MFCFEKWLVRFVMLHLHLEYFGHNYKTICNKSIIHTIKAEKGFFWDCPNQYPVPNSVVWIRPSFPSHSHLCHMNTQDSKVVVWPILTFTIISFSFHCFEVQLWLTVVVFLVFFLNFWFVRLAFPKTSHSKIRWMRDDIPKRVQILLLPMLNTSDSLLYS